MTKQITPEEQELKNTLSANIKKYRRCRNWSQFALAAKMGISTNFLADIEAGNTWVSAQTLIKFAYAFEVEAFELLKPQKKEVETEIQQEIDKSITILNRFSQDLSLVLQESVEKAINHVKKEYDIG
ncbi:MAG: helix-turn-helix domain-containing protein [Treponema sp.]|nr:helix-turn-helix domain-containing protein [Treponema sp.]